MMKVGQRKVNMMRHINAKRGFTRKDDTLPDRFSVPLLDGPAKGKCVEPKAFAKMLNQYYTLMGWDRQSGNPTDAVLMELGLDWAI